MMPGWFRKWRIRRRLLKEGKRYRSSVRTFDGTKRLWALASAAAAAGVVLGRTSPAEADTAFTTFSYLATGTTVAQNTPDRFGQLCFNVKDFGAKGDGSTNDTSAIQAAVNAMFAVAQKSCILYFPAGNYIVSGNGAFAIDISNTNGGSNYNSGIIRGAGRWATYINGNFPTGFIFGQDDAANGPEEISNLSLVNTSTVIGTGALSFNNSSMRITNCHFTGMINIFMPYNVFQSSIENCTGEAGSDGTTGGTGTFGICGFAGNVSGWRSASPYQAAMQFNGSNTATISGSSAEDLTAGLVLGFATGWANQCTVSGNVLTVGGTLGTNTSEQKQFIKGAEIFMKGLTTTADWGVSPFASTICTITETNAENPSRTGVGWAGTYTISRSATISSPVPCVSRYVIGMSGLTVSSFETEAAYFIMVVANVSNCTFISCGGSATISECVNAFGTAAFTANTGIYIRGGCGSTSFISCAPNSNAYNAAWYFDPNGADNSNLSLINCTGQRLTDNITGTSSKIDNGSGSAGTVLNVVSLTQGSGVNVGMAVTGAGVSANTVITGNHTTDNTLTGTGSTGTYRVNNSQLVTGTALTILQGADWIIPTGNDPKTGVNLIGCNSANLPSGYTSGLASGMARTYTSLPGNAGSNSNYPAQDGMVYDIVDGLAANCADGTCTTWGTHVSGGGGALHLQVRWNAAKAQWTLTGI